MKMEKIFALFLALVMVVSVFAGCAREQIGGTTTTTSSNNETSSNGNSGDETKETTPNNGPLTLYVSNYEGGFGRVWVENAIARFEELHKNDTFSDNRVGVKLELTSSINDTAGNSLIQGLPENAHDIFFSESIYYYDMVSTGYALDITDAVTEVLSEYGEDRSIEDKMDPIISDFFKTSEGKYFGIPHYEGYYGIIYNVDVFDEKGLWISTDGTYIKPDEGTKANGPDGKAGTYDDGLPATYDEFYALCDYMTTVGVTPFALPGCIASMPTMTWLELVADYEGRDSYMLNYTFDGVATDLVNSIGDGLNENGTFDDMLPATTIDMSNGYMLYHQAGYYAALEFVQHIADNAETWCTKESFMNTEDHISSKHTYLKNGRATDDNLVAFITDGTWWENEAQENNVFATWEEYGAPTRETGRFAMLPMPKASQAQVGQIRTISTENNQSCVFLNGKLASDPEKAAVAKEFVKFVHTDAEMQNFSVDTGTLKPYKYTLTEEQKSKMSYFGRDIVSVRENPDIDTVYTYAPNNTYLNNGWTFWPGYMFATHDPIADMHSGAEGASTVAEYFTLMTTSRGQEWWEGLNH